MRRGALLATLVAAAVVLQRRAASRRAERELWAEAGSAPDLR